MKKTLIALIVAALAAAHVSTASAAGKKTKGVLKAGAYTATVAGMVCGACPPQVEKTLKTFPGIEGVFVSQERSTVKFTIKKGASVKEAKLQAALKAASSKMGMGADYSLSNLARVGP